MQETVTTSSQGQPSLYTPDVDAQTTLIYTYVVYIVVCPAIAFFGIVTNIINIICFVKQHFRESINVSLLGLTISDLWCLITILLTDVFVVPEFTTADLSFDVLGVYYLTIAMPHFTFNRLSAWITAIITLERCLCIVAPLKIKMLLTPDRMFIIIICVYIILISSGAPVYHVYKLGMIFSPWRNKTIIGLISTPDREKVERITFIINNFVLPYAAFAVIIVCTTILVISLGKRAKWRQSASASQTEVNSRHFRVAKMVVIISALFISCFIPLTAISLVIALVPEFSIYNKYQNIGRIVGGIAFFTECINSSANIFIYYHMSFKYRETFNNIFCTYASHR